MPLSVLLIGALLLFVSTVNSFYSNRKCDTTSASKMRIFGRPKNSVDSSQKRSNNKRKRVKKIKMATIYTKSNNDTQGLAYFYLRDKLKISKKSLMNIVVKYPWLLYLKVEKNIRPTIDAYRTFGFKIGDVRSLVEAVPSTLGLNANWSIPERLISLQKLFYLSQPALVRAVKKHPYLVTCSVNRHIDIANFFSDSLGMSASEIRNMATFYPDVIMSNLETLQKCYSHLADVYGFSIDDIRYICVQCPRVFTPRTLLKSEERLGILRAELNLIPPFQDMQKFVLKIPSVLCMSAEYFLLPNIQLIKEYLYLSSEDLGALISHAPLLLRYRPVTLRSKLESTLAFLSSENKSTFMNGTNFDFRVQDLSVDFIDAIFEGRPTEPFLTYQQVFEESGPISEELPFPDTSQIDLLAQQLLEQSSDVFSSESVLSMEEASAVDEKVGADLDLVDLLESDETADESGGGKSWGDRVKCALVAPEDLLRLDVVGDITRHFDDWLMTASGVSISDATDATQLLDELDHLDARSAESALLALTASDKEAARWVLKESATLRLPSARARHAVKMFLPVLGYDPMRLHK